MNCSYVLIVIVICTSLLTCVSSAQARLCLENITVYVDVARIMTRTRLVSTTWYSPAQVKTETYQVIEKVPKVKQKHVCCDGYQLEAGECIPVCSSGCPDEAKCVEPETCKCQVGYRMEEDGSCRLECDGCENGQCTDLGVCECNIHYVRVENRCTPICRHKCLNGFCAAPDKCECNPGYELGTEPGHCMPACGQPCGSNAYCSGPGVCTCKYGFFGNATDVCQPWCKAECKNGECVGPNDCACHQGFLKIDGLCIPDCRSGCQFGDCLDEGVCRCWPGFVYNNATGSCQEKLDINHTTVTAPSQELKIVRLQLQASEKPYSPIYDRTMTSKPGVTESPFAQRNTSVVTNDHRICMGGTCPCQEGFVEVDISCGQICETCSIGDCVKMEACILQTTIESSSSTTESSIEISTTTTAAEVHSNCENGCWAGTCVDGVCQCRDGLILNDENDCIMPCEATCKNGVCNQDNVCECREGYVYENGTECVPQCEKECVNGFCIAPNHCECLEGYMLNLSSVPGHICLPTCDGLDGEEGCVNGTCVAVNKCHCFEGFTHKPGNRFECVPDTTPERKHSTGFWYFYTMLGLLILLVAGILGLFVIRKMYQDSYNVAKVEKHHGTVRYQNGEQPYCYI